MTQILHYFLRFQLWYFAHCACCFFDFFVLFFLLWAPLHSGKRAADIHTKAFRDPMAWKRACFNWSASFFWKRLCLLSSLYIERPNSKHVKIQQSPISAFSLLTSTTLPIVSRKVTKSSKDAEWKVHTFISRTASGTLCLRYLSTVASRRNVWAHQNSAWELHLLVAPREFCWLIPSLAYRFFPLRKLPPPARPGTTGIMFLPRSPHQIAHHMYASKAESPTTLD